MNTRDLLDSIHALKTGMLGAKYVIHVCFLQFSAHQLLQKAVCGIVIFDSISFAHITPTLHQDS